MSGLLLLLRGFTITLVAMLLPTSASLAQEPEEVQRFRLARGYEESGDVVNAGRIYLELYTADSASEAYFDGLVRTFVRQGRHQDLLPYTAGRVERFPRDIELRSLYASLLYRSARTREAVREWTLAEKEVAPREIGTYTTIANAQYEAGAIDLAILTWRAGRATLRSNTLFARELARALMTTGDIEGGMDEYLQLLDYGRDELSSVQRALASADMAPANVRRMISVVSAASTARPEFQPYIELLGWLYEEVDDVDGSFRCAIQLDAMRRSNGSEVFRFADAMLRQDRFDVALVALEHFLSTYPRTNVLTPLASLAYARALEGKYRSMEYPDHTRLRELAAKFNTLIHANADTEIGAEARLRLAQILLHDLREIERATSIAKTLVAQNPTWPCVQHGRLLLADLHVRQGRLDEARTLLAQLSASDHQSTADDVGAHAQGMQAELAFFSGEFQQAEDMFLGLTNDPTSDAANDALGFLLLIREYRERYATGLASYARGLLLARQLRWGDAVAAFVEGARLSAGSGLAERCNYECALATLAQGEAVKGVEMLLQIPAVNPNGVLADRALFDAARTIETDLGDVARARLLYERLVNDYSHSPFTARARERAAALRAD